jgi:hypothetical protein
MGVFYTTVCRAWYCYLLRNTCFVAMRNRCIGEIHPAILAVKNGAGIMGIFARQPLLSDTINDKTMRDISPVLAQILLAVRNKKR